MYLLYLDDSGSIPNKNEDYFVLGGICVPEQSVYWLSHELDKIAIKIDPTYAPNIEFHASEIFSGKIFPWDQYSTKSERIGIIKQVLQSLTGAYQDIVAFACAIHKKSYPQEDIEKMAFEDISSRFDLFLQRTSTVNDKKKGLIIVDKSSYEQGLQNLTREIRKQGNTWGNQLRTLCEVPLFIDSKASRLVQLADHIAYSVFRRYESSDLTYFNEIETRFDKVGHIYHGLVHRQTVNPDCTWPACISRKFK